MRDGKVAEGIALGYLVLGEREAAFRRI